MTHPGWHVPDADTEGLGQVCQRLSAMLLAMATAISATLVARS
jgi:hypothetical protein